MNVRYFLQTTSGRIPVDVGGLLLGRNFDCDVVLQDASVSRRHALVYALEGGVELVPLAGRSVQVEGAPVTAARRLVPGESFEIDSQRFTLRAEPFRLDDATHWFVQRPGGALLRIPRERTTLGGGTDDDVMVEGWAPHTLCLAALGARLAIEVLAPGVTVGRAMAAGEMGNVANGDEIACAGVKLRVVALPSDPAKPTLVSGSDEAVTAAVLSHYPRGGRLTLTRGARAGKVFLAGKRCRFVALMLQPPSPYAVGDVVPDAVIAEALWPGQYAGRTDINTLLWRVRGDFSDAGMDRVNLFDRVGGGVRVCVAPGSHVEVQGPTG